jgi:hypothetical protein
MLVWMKSRVLWVFIFILLVGLIGWCFVSFGPLLFFRGSKPIVYEKDDKLYVKQLGGLGTYIIEDYIHTKFHSDQYDFLISEDGTVAFYTSRSDQHYNELCYLQMLKTYKESHVSGVRISGNIWEYSVSENFDYAVFLEEDKTLCCWDLTSKTKIAQNVSDFKLGKQNSGVVYQNDNGIFYWDVTNQGEHEMVTPSTEAVILPGNYIFTKIYYKENGQIYYKEKGKNPVLLAPNGGDLLGEGDCIVREIPEQEEVLRVEPSQYPPFMLSIRSGLSYRISEEGNYCYVVEKNKDSKEYILGREPNILARYTITKDGVTDRTVIADNVWKIISAKADAVIFEQGRHYGAYIDGAYVELGYRELNEPNQTPVYADGIIYYYEDYYQGILARLQNGEKQVIDDGVSAFYPLDAKNVLYIKDVDSETKQGTLYLKGSFGWPIRIAEDVTSVIPQIAE